MEFTTGQIAALLGGRVEGNNNQVIRMVGKIETAHTDELAFLSNPLYEKFIYESNAGAVLVKSDFRPKKSINTTLIYVDDPYTAFTQLLKEYEKMTRFQKSGIEEPSQMDATVTHGEDIYVGAFSYIGKNVQLGNNVKIHPQCYIGDNVTIGNNCLIYPGVKIYHDTQIGNDCVLHSGVVLGSDGFGFAPKSDGTYENIPQLGRVRLCDRVSLGANTVIDRATLPGEETLIDEGTKLDNLIQVGHNAYVGKNTVIAAQTGVAGSSKVGNNCMIAGQVGIAGHLNVPDNTKIAAQAGIAGSVKKEGLSIFGTPAIPIKDYMRSYTVFRKLPQIYKDVEKLKRENGEG